MTFEISRKPRDLFLSPPNIAFKTFRQTVAHELKTCQDR
jgi:hypothetical protein